MVWDHLSPEYQNGDYLRLATSDLYEPSYPLGPAPASLTFPKGREKQGVIAGFLLNEVLP
jgi:hypothetical protein